MFCQQTKEFLSQKGVKFVEKDIVAQPPALDDLRKLGYMTTPVTVIGNDVIVGFDVAKIEAALAKE